MKWLPAFEFQSLLRILLAAGVSFGALIYPNATFAVMTADEVCGPSEDPCSVTQTFALDDGAILDFGSRKLQIIGNGRFTVGSSTAEIRCGELDISRSGKAIDVGTSALGGQLNIEVLGSCTAGPPSLRCTSDATCAVFAGVCDSDSANARIAGGIDGDSNSPGTFSLTTAGDVTVLSPITMSGSNLNSGGGTVFIDAGRALTVSAKISATAGGGAGGGTIELIAGDNALVTGELDAHGGDFDGGAVAVTAGGELRARSDVNAAATAAGGFGGEILFAAGTDLLFDGGAAANRQTLTTDGSGSAEAAGGDGGLLTLSAGQDVEVGPFVRLRARGAAPDGFGGEVEISVFRDLDFSGEIQLNARGGSGGGGLLDIDVGESLSLGGSIDLEGATGMQAGDLLVVAMDLAISGELSVAGEPFELDPMVINVRACNIDLAATASWENATNGGLTAFYVLNQITAVAGADISATRGGTNEIHQKIAQLDPSVAAAFSPSPNVIIEDSLPDCARCGDGVIGAGETCDDGNRTPGDGCNETCQLEGCVAQTPGWPIAPLCDDGKECTSDVCNVETATCSHMTNCDDGTACTIDACQPDGSCGYTPSDARCDDGNPCTNGICTSASGCFQFSKEDEPCDDGLTCTANDMCGEGICSGDPFCGPGEICLPASDTCGIPTTTLPSTTTTSSTTTTTLSGGSCGNGVVEAGEACDSGIPWEAGMQCRNDCTEVLCGDPNDSGDLAASDALFVLLSAVGAEACDCTCDVDGNTQVTASDALRVLRAAVGVPVGMACSCA